MEGINKTKPIIKKIEFSTRGKMTVYFEDGRIIMVPLIFFPSIKSLNKKQRDKWYVFGDEGFSFDDCKEVFHIEQILGSYNDYKYVFFKD